MNTKIATLCLAVAVALAGCVDLDQTDSADVTPVGKIASNSMLPGVIVGNSLNSAALTSSSIYQSGISSTASGRSYLSYMIECALPARTQVTSMYGGTNYVFAGAYGLASAWTTRALTTSESRLVSACVLARSNVYGQSVMISMRGDSSTLATTTDELANYNTEEGAFYGSIFDRAAGALHACDGVDQVRDGDTFGDLALRQCAQPDPNNPGYTPCNFVYDGACSDICVRNGDHYSTCGTQTDVITILLQGTAP